MSFRCCVPHALLDEKHINTLFQQFREHSFADMGCKYSWEWHLTKKKNYIKNEAEIWWKYMTFVFFLVWNLQKVVFHTRTQIFCWLSLKCLEFCLLLISGYRKSTLLHVSFNKTHTRTHPQTHQYLLLLIKNFIKKNKRETNKEKQLRYIRKVSQKEMKRVRWINATNKT